MRLADEPVQVADGVADLAHDVGPRHVRPAAGRVVLRPQVEADRRVGHQGPRPRLVPDRVARAHGRDDDVGGQRRAQPPAELAQPRAQPLGGQDLALPLQDAVARARLAQDAGRLGSEARPASVARRIPASSASVLRRRRRSNPSWSTASSTPRPRRGRRPRPGSRAGTSADRTPTRSTARARSSSSTSWRGRPCGDQLAAAELLAQDALDVGRGRREAVGLQDVRQHDPAAVVLGVEERVADRRSAARGAARASAACRRR